MTKPTINNQLSISPSPITSPQQDQSNLPPKTQPIITQNTASNHHISQEDVDQTRLNLKQNSFKTVQLSSSARKSKNSRQLPFYEAVITVALLVTALWMQASPNWQFPSSVKGNSLTLPPINNPWQPR